MASISERVVANTGIMFSPGVFADISKVAAEFILIIQIFQNF